MKCLKLNFWGGSQATCLSMCFQWNYDLFRPGHSQQNLDSPTRERQIRDGKRMGWWWCKEQWRMGKWTDLALCEHVGRTDRPALVHRPLCISLLKADLPRIPFTTDAFLLLKSTSASLLPKLGPLDTHRYPITPPTQPALRCIFPPPFQSIRVPFFPQQHVCNDGWALNISLTGLQLMPHNHCITI